MHRNWMCKRTDAIRAKYAREEDIFAARQLEVRGHPTWERGLTARPAMPLRKKSAVETFHWHVRPKEGLVHGRGYPDGSARDGPTPELVRLGWSFAVLDDRGHLIAAAYGVPPPWIVDIGGAEAWALYQLLLCTTPQMTKYWPDCYPLKVAISKGQRLANDPRNALARVHGMLFTALEGIDEDAVGWMPAHLTTADLALGTATKSDGSLVTATDILGNDVADRLAKLGAEFHRVAMSDVRRWKKAFAEAKARAKWIGKATHAANNCLHYPYRDSEAARWKAVAAQRRNDERRAGVDGRKKRAPKQIKPIIPVDRGGHNVERARSGQSWLCTTCKCRSASWSRLATTKCGGSKRSDPSKMGGEAVIDVAKGGRKHLLITSGTVVWCGICGSFAETRTSRRMTNSCNGPPPAAAGTGGMRQQLQSLRNNVHPVTGVQLPAPLGNSALGNGTYSRLKPTAAPSDGFVPYAPISFEPAAPSGVSAENKRQIMRDKVLCKVNREAVRLKRLLRREARAEVKELIESFTAAANCEVVTAVVNGPASSAGATVGEDEQSDEDFWTNLPTLASQDRTHIREIPTQAARAYPGKAVRTRADVLKVTCL